MAKDGHETTRDRFLSHDLAEWAAGLKYGDLSPTAVRAAKLFWLDSLGCALGGSQQHDVKLALEHLLRQRLQYQRRRCGLPHLADGPPDRLQRHLLERGPPPPFGHPFRPTG